jgi:hypothetical protein
LLVLELDDDIEDVDELLVDDRLDDEADDILLDDETDDMDDIDELLIEELLALDIDTDETLDALLEDALDKALDKLEETTDELFPLPFPVLLDEPPATVPPVHALSAMHINTTAPVAGTRTCRLLDTEIIRKCSRGCCDGQL